MIDIKEYAILQARNAALVDLFAAQTQEYHKLQASWQTGAKIAVKLRTLLQELAQFLDGEPYGVRTDDNDDAVDSYVEQCQEMIARIKKVVSHEG